MNKREFIDDWESKMGTHQMLTEDSVLEYINLRAQADARPVEAGLILACDIQAIRNAIGLAKKEGWTATVDQLETILTRASAATMAEPSDDPDVPESIRLLGLMFDGYEDGTACHEEGGGYIGQAFHIDDEAFQQIANLLNRRNPPRYDVQKNGLVVPHRAQQQAEPGGADERAAFEAWQAVELPSHHRNNYSAADMEFNCYEAALSAWLERAKRAAQSGQRAGVAEEARQVHRGVPLDPVLKHVENGMPLGDAMIAARKEGAATPTQQQEE